MYITVNLNINLNIGLTCWKSEELVFFEIVFQGGDEDDWINESDGNMNSHWSDKATSLQ